MTTLIGRCVAVLLPIVFCASCASPTPNSVQDDRWQCQLDSPGGALPFLMDWDGGDTATIHNGEEAIDVDVQHDEDGVIFDFAHYDSRIRVTLSEEGDRLQGLWTRTSGPDSRTEMPFSAVRGGAETSVAPESDFNGNWSVQFESEDSASMAIFDQLENGSLTGTFRTTKGDYRFLEGYVDGDRLQLSVFDGAHAFLFKAKAGDDNSISGDFWSRDTWHETWTATRADDVDLGDPFERTAWAGDVDWGSLQYPDLDLKMRSLDDPAFAGPVRILELYGSWCPNCNDAAVLMSELHDRYSERGLSILGLAFEMTGEIERDAELVRRYEERYDIHFPSLLVGRADKDVASEAFPLIDRVHAYPTFIFLDAEGTVRAVYAGFEGPATGDLYKELVDRFTTLIESLLTEAGA